jgi:HSP20 family protein
MFPFDRSKPVRKPSMFGGFAAFDDMFADFEAQTEKLMEEAQKAGGQSFVYAYRSYPGADGKPVVEEYSNIPGLRGSDGGQLTSASSCASGCSPSCAPSLEGTGEPYYDVLDGGDKIKVVVEMPGVEKEKIKVQSHGRHVTVAAESQYHKFAADIPVPDYVGAKPRKAQYNNGVLEITYAKEDEPTDVLVE